MGWDRRDDSSTERAEEPGRTGRVGERAEKRGGGRRRRHDTHNVELVIQQNRRPKQRQTNKQAKTSRDG